MTEAILYQDNPLATKVASKVEELIIRATGLNPDIDALMAIKEIRTKGLPTYITGCIDYTGSMHDDVLNVQTGISNWMRQYTSKLPTTITDQLGTDFLRITGATIGFRDIEFDAKESFEMALFSNVRPETYIAKSTGAYSISDVRGGGRNLGESSLISLLLSYGLNRENQAIDRLFSQLKTIMKEPASYQTIGEKGSYDKLVELYDSYTKYLKYQQGPNLVYLVTDEPPIVQLCITPDLLAQMKPQDTKMVFFVRNFTKKWEIVANKLGATLIDLGEIDKASTELNVSKDDLIGRALTSIGLNPLFEAISHDIDRLLPDPARKVD